MPSKAEQYAARKQPVFKDKLGKYTAWVDENSDLIFDRLFIEKDEVLALIAWMQDTFIDPDKCKHGGDTFMVAGSNNIECASCGEIIE